MSRTIVEPVTQDGSRPDETITRHPAFAQIAAIRTSGSSNLYDSDFRHNAYMTIRISHSELHRSLSRDWHYDTQQIIEVAMSEAQWATFVGSPNVGTGTPCTLKRLNNQFVPDLPDPVKRADQFGADMRKNLQSCLDEIKAAYQDIEQLQLSKAKEAKLRSRLAAIERELASNLPFVAESFDEHLEESVEKAKSEIHGYMTGVVMRAGLESLRGPQAVLPLALTHQSDDSPPGQPDPDAPA